VVVQLVGSGLGQGEILAQQGTGEPLGAYGILKGQPQVGVHASGNHKVESSSIFNEIRTPVPASDKRNQLRPFTTDHAQPNEIAVSDIQSLQHRFIDF